MGRSNYQGEWYKIIIKSVSELFPTEEAKRFYNDILLGITSESTYEIFSMKFAPYGVNVLVHDTYGGALHLNQCIASANEKYSQELGYDVSEINVNVKNARAPRGGKEKNRSIYRSAKNSNKLLFRTVQVSGKAAFNIFKDDIAIKYYIHGCFKDLENIPVTVLAYAILPNNAYFVVSTYDQADASIKAYFNSANVTYSNYYADQYVDAGFVFNEKIRIKEIAGVKNIIPAIINVHSQPIIAGLASSFTDYPHTSYMEEAGTGLASLEPLIKVIGAKELTYAYLNAHRTNETRSGGRVFLGFAWTDIKPEKLKFDADLEAILAKYGVLGKKNIPEDVMIEIILDVNEKGKYSFNYIINRLFVDLNHRYEILMKTFVTMLMRSQLTFDECASSLGLLGYSDNKLIYDIIYKINEKTGYAYDYILGKLGFAYPNQQLLVKLFGYIKEKYGFSYGQLIKKYNLYDEKLLKYLSATL
ncbi:MAG: hypothetical protein LBU04_03405 [Christensenellaceae bacterium]|jgi:hypothetical protein|nr:hypothetical protein [Christensenellaceae bacterium]